MEVGGSILDVIDEELSFGDCDDVEMMDVEEGEVVDGQLSLETGDGNGKGLEAQASGVNNQNANDMNKKKRKKKKRKSKKGKANPGPGHFDLDRFVIGVCKRLREKKSYLVYTAVGVLGASAFGDLVNEVERTLACDALWVIDSALFDVDAIQACGGQKTAEGNRYRTGGGILWNILKTRDPNAYKEIMKKGKDFEKQFRRPSAVSPAQNGIASESAADAVTSKPTANSSDADLEMNSSAGQLMQPICEEKRRSVRDRIRVPVSYDDLPGQESPKDQPS